MKKAIILLLATAMLMPLTANAQGVKFGKRYAKQRIEQRQKAAEIKAAAEAAVLKVQMKTASGNILDEYEEKEDDRIFRYVYAYDANMMRSSERIYMKEKTDGEWGNEREITTGKYNYEYDAQGRLSVKTVTYTDNDYFKSYRVTVAYGDGLTEYEKTEWDDYDKGYVLTERWSYYDNGILASYSNYSDGYTINGQKETSLFNEDGVYSGYIDREKKMEISGDINNPVLSYYVAEGYDEETHTCTSWTLIRQESYKHDPATGKLLEHIVVGDDTNPENYSYDNEKAVYTYDDLGRLVSIEEYGTGDDEDNAATGDTETDLNGDGVPDYMQAPAKTAAKALSLADVEWTLDFKETYTYFNNDVYGVGNSWHDVFGMDGPLASIDLYEDYHDGYEEYKSQTTFTRDADGKLTGISTYTEGNDEPQKDNSKYSIDADGHLLSIVDEFSEKYETGFGEETYYNRSATDYTWDGDKVTKKVESYEYERTYWNGEKFVTDSGEGKDTWQYTYGDGKVTVAYYWGDSTEPEETTTIEEHGNARRVVSNGSLSDKVLARYTQTENISFVRPNLAADIAGMAADSTITVSVAGRVVCAYCGDLKFGHNAVGLVEPDFHDDNVYFANTMSGSTYFTIEHDGNQTVCSDIEGLPIYVLEDSRLVREYIYYDEVYNHGPDMPDETPLAAMRTVSVPDGQAYTEITYAYDTQGRLAGKSEVSVDDTGKRTEEIKLEYVYTEPAGIVSVEALAQAGVSIDGRRIGLSAGMPFTVCTVGGQVLATGATQYTLPASGIYIISSDNLKVKIAVR